MNQHVQAVDPEIIRLALEETAPIYECKRTSCPCGNGVEVLASITQVLNECVIDQQTARAYAHGVLCSLLALVPVEPPIPSRITAFMGLLVTESLRLAADITDAQIEAACQRFRERKAPGAVIGDALQNLKEQFGQIPVTKGSCRDN